MRFKLLALVSCFAEFTDMQFTYSPDMETLAQSTALTALGTHSSMPAPLIAGQPPVVPRVSATTPLRPIFRMFGALMDGVEEFVPAVASPTLSPLALAEPALYVSVHFMRYCMKLLYGTNAAALAGVTNAALCRAPFLAANSMFDLGRQVGDFLDTLDGLKRHDLASHSAGARPSDLYRLIIHAEVILHWLLGSIAAQVRQVRRFVMVQQRSLRRFAEQQRLLGNVSVAQSAEALILTIHSNPDTTDELDPDTLYQTAIATALQHSDRMSSLNGIGSVKTHAASIPSESIVGTAISVFMSRAFEDIITGLINEQQDPSFAFCPAQLCEHARLFESEVLDADESAITSPLVTADDIAALLAWQVCFENERESAPSIGIQPLLHFMAAAHFARPCVETFRSSAFELEASGAARISALALEQRREALAPFIEASCGKTIRSLFRMHAPAVSASSQTISLCAPSGTVSSNIVSTTAVNDASASAAEPLTSAPSSFSSSVASAAEANVSLAYFRASPRTLRSMRPVHLLQLALSLAQRLEDSCASAVCVLHLAMLFFYWIPHYEVAGRLLERLDDECTALLHHLPPGIGPSFERSVIIMCQTISRDVLRQFNQHRAANLRSPFFVGKLVSLPFAEGTIEGLMCPFSASSRMVLVCEHPTRGLIHSSTLMIGNEVDFAALCSFPAMWRDPFATALSDWPMQMVMGGWFRIMVHEFRLGRYSFARLLADVRARERFDSIAARQPQ